MIRYISTNVYFTLYLVRILGIVSQARLALIKLTWHVALVCALRTRPISSSSGNWKFHSVSVGVCVKAV